MFSSVIGTNEPVTSGITSLYWKCEYGLVRVRVRVRARVRARVRVVGLGLERARVRPTVL